MVVLADDEVRHVRLGQRVAVVQRHELESDAREPPRHVGADGHVRGGLEAHDAVLGGQRQHTVGDVEGAPQPGGVGGERFGRVRGVDGEALRELSDAGGGIREALRRERTRRDGRVERRLDLGHLVVGVGGADAQQVASAGDRAHGGGRDADLSGCAGHVERVGDDHAAEAEVAAQHPLEDARGEGGGAVGVELRQQDVARHDGARPSGDRGLERHEFAFAQRLERQVDHGQRVVGVG